MILAKKLLLIFLVTLVLAFVAIYYMTYAMIDQNNSATIQKEQMDVREVGETYIRHLLMQQTGTGDGDFVSSAPVLGEELEDLMGRPVALYGADGTPLYGDTRFTKEVTEDLRHALLGKSAYSLIRESRQAVVYCAFPLEDEAGQFGAARILTNYTDLILSGQELGGGITTAAMVILLVVFALVYGLVRKSLWPVSRMTRVIRDFTAAPSQKAEKLDLKRKDEIGVLAHGFDEMAATIQDQMATIQREKENLRQSLRYRKDFYDNVTHELKTPITIILGYGEMMRSTDLADPEFCKKGLDQIIEESRRLSYMVTELLEQSGPIDVDPAEETALVPLLNGLCEKMELKANRYGARMETRLEGRPLVRGGEEKLRQLFVNLLDNAIKYGQPGWPIGVYLQTEEEICRVQVRNRVEEGSVDVSRIFAPFYQGAKDKESGSVGLGLAICRNIAEALGGRIEARLEEGPRICLEVILPKAAEQEEDANDQNN